MALPPRVSVVLGSGVLHAGHCICCIHGGIDRIAWELMGQHTHIYCESFCLMTVSDFGGGGLGGFPGFDH